MHEMPIAQGIIDQVQQVASENDAQLVTRIEVDLGEMRMVVPEALDAAFKAVSNGTIAEGAQLIMNDIPAEACCNVCQHRFKPDVEGCFLCPNCQQADVEIVEGKDIILRSITCDQQQEGDA
jgi:hydrogenase nickel incorporation protein HypA/HybF